MISAGGALGGLFVSLLAPRLFSTYVEWRLGLVVGCLLAVYVLFDSKPESFFRKHFVGITAGLLLAFVGIKGFGRVQTGVDHEVIPARNFYGVISVVERNADDPERHVFNFYSGRIVHGLQFVDPDKRREPTAYFGRETGVGRRLPRCRTAVRRAWAWSVSAWAHWLPMPTGSILPLLRVERRRAAVRRRVLQLPR